MSQTDVIDVISQGLLTVLIVSSPMLIAALVIGFVVSVFQAATQINEQTLSFVPKIIGVFASMIVFGPWMLTKLMDFTEKLYAYISVNI